MMWQRSYKTPGLGLNNFIFYFVLTPWNGTDSCMYCDFWILQTICKIWDKQYDQLWGIRIMSATLNRACAKFGTLSEHLAVDKVNVEFRGRVIFMQYIPKKCFGIRIYKFWSLKAPISHDSVIKDAKTTTGNMMTTHSTVTNLTCKV
jgi:hypothetical protein